MLDSLKIGVVAIFVDIFFPEKYTCFKEPLKYPSLVLNGICIAETLFDGYTFNAPVENGRIP
jgi:hypothetical protein